MFVGLWYALQGELPWTSSLCLVVPKFEGTSHFCKDFQEANFVALTNSILPHLEDCIEIVSPAVINTELDLLKGYWHVPLIPRACNISVFLNPDPFWQYTVMACGVRNVPTIFQCMMHLVLGPNTRQL